MSGIVKTRAHCGHCGTGGEWRWMRRWHSMSGWTLIELSIVLFIITLLSAFAIPSYREHIARGHRWAAVDALQTMALMAESASAGASAHDAAGPATGRYGKLADRFVPPHGMPIYRVTMLPGSHRIGAIAMHGYVLQAVPIPTGSQAGDACGTFVLDASGVRMNRHVSGQWIPDAASCWRGGRAPARSP